MGKDIDRNITRQLWERLKNTFSKNDVIPVENGGTGETSLVNLFGKSVNSKQIKEENKNTVTFNTGITPLDNFNAVIIVNTNSIVIRGTISVKKETSKQERAKILSFPVVSDARINNILVYQNTRINVINGICTILSGFSTNTFTMNYPTILIPFI